MIRVNRVGYGRTMSLLVPESLFLPGRTTICLRADLTDLKKTIDYEYDERGRVVSDGNKMIETEVL